MEGWDKRLVVVPGLAGAEFVVVPVVVPVVVATVGPVGFVGPALLPLHAHFLRQHHAN
jgi:hypothetical protein